MCFAYGVGGWFVSTVIAGTDRAYAPLPLICRAAPVRTKAKTKKKKPRSANARKQTKPASRRSDNDDGGGKPLPQLIPDDLFG